MTNTEAQPEILTLVAEHSSWQLRSAEIQALMSLAFSFGDETLIIAFSKLIQQLQEKYPATHRGVIINAEYVMFGSFLKALANETAQTYGLFKPDEEPYSMEEALRDSDENNPAVAA